jgi:hypothetical protein
MREYGVVQDEGASGYGFARIGLRAPRVAVLVETRANWQSMFGLAMSMASSLWGGYGFIYLPRGTGKLHPALARILTAYDPDYLVDALWTHGDVEAMGPGWHARHYKGWPTDSQESTARLASYLAEEVVHDGLGEDIGAHLCSPFYEDEDTRWMRVLSEKSDGRGVHRLATVLGGDPRADFEVPDGIDPLLLLALGMRAGYPAKPLLPLGHELDGVAERLPHPYVRYALSIRKDGFGREFRDLTTAWSLTQTGLVQIGKALPRARPVAVIGSTPEDFALAVALDRMYGAAMWMPVEWAQDPNLHWPVEEAYRSLLNEARACGHPPIVTTISLSKDELDVAVQTHWPGPVLGIWVGSGQVQTIGGEQPEMVAAEHLDLQAPKHLACAGDFDLSFTSPTQADGRGGFDFVLPVPAHTPRSEELRVAQRPFWEVDVEVYPQRMPAGRNLRGRALLADDQPYPSTVVRSGRDGISFNPMNMLFVPGGATLEQSIARPRLRVPGLRGWIEALATQDHPGMTVRLSQAGRRAMILARLWGSRSAVAQDLLELNDFLREFKPPGSRDIDAYPEADGVRLAPGEGYLTFDAAIRTLPGMKPGEIRERINRLLRINALHRGLIVPCSECERRAFYRIELAGETNRCPRCGALARATSAWRSEQDEPQWFYDLHGAVRELLEQNGDVPFLVGRHLATARGFEDIAELDFHWPDKDEPDEIDVAALMDGRIAIGETKCVATLGIRKESNRTIQKLIRISDLVGADEILLATTAPGPWDTKDISQLLKAVAGKKWRFGTAPRIRVITDLRSIPQNKLLDYRDAFRMVADNAQRSSS